MGIRAAIAAAVLGTGAIAAPVPSPTTEIPDRAYQAYVSASQNEENACGVEWFDLAAIGKLETDHSRFGGRTLTPDGKMTPILWVWDVRDMGGGPMAFLDSSWRTFGAGGDVQDIDDATVAAVRLLCHNGYATDPDTAIRRYNGSGPKAERYKAKAIALRERYRTYAPSTGGATTSSSSEQSSAALNVLDWVTVRTIGRIGQTLDLVTSSDGPISGALEGPEASFDAWAEEMLTTTATTAPRPAAGNLVNVRTHSDLYRSITVDASIASDVQRLLDDAASQGVILSGWGWRSEQRTAELRVINGCPDIHTSPARSCRTPTARPGSSQHEKGLTVDFRNCPRSSACFQWLSRNAARYGLHNLPSESWHWSTTGR